MLAYWGSEQQEELRYQVLTTHIYYLASEGRLLYTPNIELVG